jgi:hypothetical protein
LYNLFVTYTEGQWDKGVFESDTGRTIQGYTDKTITHRFKDLDETAIAELMSLPCLFAYETGRGEEVFLGWITDIKPRRSGVRVEFELERSLPPFSHAAIAKLTSQLDVGKFELTHTHWAVKDVDLLPALIKAGLLQESDIHRHGTDSRLVRLGLTKPVTDLRVHPRYFACRSAKPSPMWCQ